MTEHLGEAASNGQLDVGGGRSSVGYKVTAKQADSGSVRISVSVMAPRDWLLKQGFKTEATLTRSQGDDVIVYYGDGELDVSDSISVTLSADEMEYPSVEMAQERFPELDIAH